jgi:cytochrome c-type biogenesis protein CcmH/NrfF
MSLKAETVGQTAGGLGAIAAGMTITEIIPWFLGVVLVVLSIVVQVYSIRAKNAEIKNNEAEARKHEEELKRLKASE